MAEITKVALKVDNNQSFPNNNNGAITPSILRAFNTNMIDSLVDEVGYTLDSGSWNQQIDALEQFTASAQSLTTGSLLITASAVSNVITFTKGNGTTFNVTVADTTDLSQLNQATASLQAFTASADIRLNNLETTTASLNSSVTQLNANTASQQVSINNLNTTTASLLVETQNLELFSASALISITNLNASSASQQTQINSLIAGTGSYATTGSNTFVGANTFTSISASSFISASQFVGDGSKLTNITSSISMPILDEGIPQGNAVSLNFTGSGISAFVAGGTAIISVNTPDSGTINNLTASFNAYTSSTDAKFLAVQASTASLNSFTASFNSNTFVGTASFNSYTQSNDQRVSSLETNSASVNTSISALNTFTASQSTASLVTSITNLNTFTSSQLTINTAIGASTSSLNSATASLFTSASLALVTASFDNGTRNLTFTKGNTTQFSVNIPDASGSVGTTIYDTVYTGESITKGDPLYISGSQGANPIVFKADAAVPAKMPVTYVSNQTIGAGTTTEAIILGHIEGVDLTGYTAGQSIYVAEGGGFSTSLPSGSNSITQLLGVITKGGSGGKGLVLNPGPAQLPGLDTGKMWVGNGNNQPAEITTASFASSASFNTYTSSTNSRLTNIESATGSLFTSTSLSLTTASFSGNTLTFTKGNGTTFGVVIPDVSGSTINTGSFATTGSNTFVGNQIISAAVFIDNNPLYILGQYPQMQLGANANGSGSQYPGVVVTVDSALYQVDGVYGALGVYDAGQSPTKTMMALAANSYTRFGPEMVGGLFGGGLNDAGDDSAIVLRTGSATMYVEKPTIFRYPAIIQGNTTISGSLILSSSAATELQVIGNMVVTGSAFGNVVSMSITSNTASMDLSRGNYFTLTLADTATTHISASNVQPGVSATLVITTGTNSSASLAPTMLQPSGSAYSATNGSAKKDVLSIVAVASGVPFVVSTKNMI